jgi:1-acyl-sn-glycerol-3-phosphate acyltransferase
MQPMPPESVSQSTIELMKPLLDAAMAYHDYGVVGLDHVPDKGAAIVVFTHSLATYDILLFGATVYLKKHRLIASLADRAIFKTPFLRQAAQKFAAVQGEPEIARRIIDAERLLGVAPGGMREALRPSEKKYQVDWERRTGFVRLALETQTPVLLAACPAADDCFEIFENPITKFVYDRFRLPLPLALGSGLLPKKAKLTHLVSEPIQPPKVSDVTDAAVIDFHTVLKARMTSLIEEALTFNASRL